MIGRLDLCLLRVAELAAKGRIDFGVTNHTVCHLGEIDLASQIRFFHAAMTCQAGNLSIQLRPDILSRRQIVATINRGSDDRRQVSQFQMELMAKAKIPRRDSRWDSALWMLVANRAFTASLPSIVALQTVFFGGKIVVGCRDAILRTGMAVLA